MKTAWKWILLTLVFAVIAFMLTPVFWPRDPAMASPASALLPYFIIVSIIEDLAFGLGMAYFLLVMPKLKSLPKTLKTRVTLAYLSITWLLISWWPHDNFHQVVGMDFQKLLYLEYGFHLTLIVAAAILAYNSFKNFTTLMTKA